MTEAEWLASDDPCEMYFRVVRPLRASRYRTDQFCLACARLVMHLLDEDTRAPFDWLDEHPGERPVHPPGTHLEDCFVGVARRLYEARWEYHRASGPLRPGVKGATHVAYDFWMDWYEYAFENLAEKYYFGSPDGALLADFRVYLPAVMRDIFGNPFRPFALPPACRTPGVLALARAAYDERTLPAGYLDADRLAVLADALEDAGATGDILAHLRSSGPHVRGCWALDAALGRE